MKKTKNIVSTPETEAYFAAKNKRRKWWAENWGKFILYPVVAVAACFISAIVIGGICLGIYTLGKKLSIEPDKITPLQEKVERLSQEVASANIEIWRLKLPNAEIESINERVLRIEKLPQPIPEVWFTNFPVITNFSVEMFVTTNHLLIEQ